MNNIFIISAPSGAGKTTICNNILQKFFQLAYSISHTTRKPRKGETNGVEYFFISKEEFEQGIKEKKWAEWASVYDNYYGTSVDFLNGIIESGKFVLLDIDVQGAKQLIEKYPDCITIFIMPPSMEVLKERLTLRETDTKEIIEKRMKNAQKEMQEKEMYKYIVINDDLQMAINEVSDIFDNAIKGVTL